MKISHFAAVGLGSAVLIVVSSASAFAGEVTGNGTPTQGPAHSNSICVFSGLDTQDMPDGTEEPDPEGNFDDDAAERGNQSPGGVDRYHGVQSYGILVAAGIPKEFLPSPGMACNGHTGFLAGGGEE